MLHTILGLTAAVHLTRVAGRMRDAYAIGRVWVDNGSLVSHLVAPA
jgi:hypothetical protein